MVQQGIVSSRTQAQKLINAACVEFFAQGHWQVCTKPASSFDTTTQLRVAPLPELQFASRAGLKLQGALEHVGLQKIDGCWLDVGQSTGGFTDCLLQAGANRVIGIEVGKDQLLPHLRQDAKVLCLEGINARQLPIEHLLGLLAEPLAGVVMDVSFISQTLIHPELAKLMPPGCPLLSLVKPQFEAGPEHIGKGGIVSSAAVYPLVQQRMESSLLSCGFTVQDYFPSPIRGGDGNAEFFVLAIK